MFEAPLVPDNSPIDNTNISTFQLFYSAEQLREFKDLAKKGLMQMYPTDFAERNASDFILDLLRLYNDLKLY
jgi:hypothetical protein